jgi:hypothetical protein
MGVTLKPDQGRGPKDGIRSPNSSATLQAAKIDLNTLGGAGTSDRLRSPIECLGGRHGEGSDAQQQRKEEAKAGQEQEEGRRSDLTVQTRLLVRQPIRQEALGAGFH